MRILLMRRERYLELKRLNLPAHNHVNVLVLPIFRLYEAAAVRTA